MKRAKDRLHRVVVLGATPSGISAANKLGELGVPVTLVDSEPDLHEKLSREQWRLDSGVPFSYAHRSGPYAHYAQSGYQMHSARRGDRR